MTGTASQPVLPPAVSGSLTVDAREALKRAIDRETDRLKKGQGQAQVTADLQGVEASITYKPKSWLSVGGYAQRQWGAGGWSAGAKATATWGK